MVKRLCSILSLAVLFLRASTANNIRGYNWKPRLFKVGMEIRLVWLVISRLVLGVRESHGDRDPRPWKVMLWGCLGVMCGLLSGDPAICLREYGVKLMLPGMRDEGRRDGFGVGVILSFRSRALA